MTDADPAASSSVTARANGAAVLRVAFSDNEGDEGWLFDGDSTAPIELGYLTDNSSAAAALQEMGNTSNGGPPTATVDSDVTLVESTSIVTP